MLLYDVNKNKKVHKIKILSKMLLDNISKNAIYYY